MNQLPGDAERAAKVQLRADIERALTRYVPDDDEAELHDVVASLVEAASRRLTIERDKQHHDIRKKTLVTLASVYLGLALNKPDRDGVAMMLKRPGFTFAQLTARLQAYLGRHLRGDEADPDVQRLVDAWAARRLAEQPAPRDGASVRTVLAAAGAVAVTGAVAVSHHPVIKAALHQGLEKAKQQIQQWSKSDPPEAPTPS